MEIKLEIPEYDPNTGMRYKWEKGFNIKVNYEDNAVILSANEAGLCL